MADAAGRERWGHTTAVMCLIANVNRDPKKGRPFRPSDFDPYAKADAKRPATAEDLMMLRTALEGRFTTAKPTGEAGKGKDP